MYGWPTASHHLRAWSCRAGPGAATVADRLAQLGVAARVGRDALGALPHLQVGLGAAGHVVDDRVAVLAGDLAQVLDPVGVEAVLRDAVDVDVVDPLAGVLLVDRDAAEPA